MATGLLFDPRYLDHFAGPYHPETPERLTTTYHHLQQLEWFKKIRIISPRPAEEKWICLVHSPVHFRRIETACREGLRFIDTPDVGISRESFQVALLAAGGTLELADQTVAGNIKNAFALLRPPGHHAEAECAMGFCLFNNVAILTRYLQTQHGIGKVAILDWDVHHGNGTQHIFEEDPSVLYASLHQYPHYPGTGTVDETGKGRGRGWTLNCPMPPDSGDKDYEKAFTEKIIPKMNEFKPEFVLISAGFDGHAKDPLSQTNLTTPFYGWMTERMMEIAAKYANDRLISLLEGGYNTEVMPQCIEEHLSILAGQ